MRIRRNADAGLRDAERRFRANSTDENYRTLAKASLRAGKPLVTFTVVEGGAAGGPREHDGSCVWLVINVSGRALPGNAGIEDHEWVDTHLAQFTASQESVARMVADAMTASETAQLERWTDREEVNSKLRISGPDYMARVDRRAVDRSVFTELFQQAGFGVWHTGGGCTAWAREAPDGRHVLITGDDANCPEPDDEEIMVGLYDEEGDSVEGAEVEAFSNTLEGAQEAISYALRSLGL